MLELVVVAIVATVAYRWGLRDATTAHAGDIAVPVCAYPGCRVPVAGRHCPIHEASTVEF